MKRPHRLRVATAETRIAEQSPGGEKPAARQVQDDYDCFAKDAAWNAGMLAGLAHYDRLTREFSTETNEGRARVRSAVGAALHKLAEDILTLTSPMSLQLGQDVAREVAVRISNAGENSTNVHIALLCTSHAFAIFGRVYFKCIEEATRRAGT